MDKYFDVKKELDNFQQGNGSEKVMASGRLVAKTFAI